MVFEYISSYVAFMGLIILIIGNLLSLIIFLSYLNTKNPGSIGLALTIFGATNSWLGGSLSLINFILNGEPISDQIYIYTFMWGIGLAFPGLTYMAVYIIREEQLKFWVLISSLFSLSYLIMVYILWPLGIVDQTDFLKLIPLDGTGIQESAFTGYALFFAIILIFSGVLFGILLLRYGLSSNIPEVRLRGLFMGLGLLIFAISSIIDAALDVTTGTVAIIIISRIIIIFSLIILTIGVLTPNFLKRYFK